MAAETDSQTAVDSLIMVLGHVMHYRYAFPGIGGSSIAGHSWCSLRQSYRQTLPK